MNINVGFYKGACWSRGGICLPREYGKPPSGQTKAIYIGDVAEGTTTSEEFPDCYLPTSA